MSEQQALETTEAPEETGPVIISVENPSTEEMAAIIKNIKDNYDFSVTPKATRFNFKRSKDKDTGIETVRSAVELPIPYPSMDGLLTIISEGQTPEGKQALDLLMEAIESTVNAVARDMLGEDVTLSAANFPVEKLAWNVIAAMPKAQRRGGGIPKETWDDFEKDYIEVMPTAANKTISQVSLAAKILKGRLSSVKTNEVVLKMLTEQLAIYAEKTPNLEEYAEIVSFLIDKSETFLNVSEEDLLANL